MKTLVFFNNKGGVGKTSLVYHVAWMLRELGLTVVMADLDPQSNLTSACLDEEVMQSLWAPGPESTILACLKPVLERLGDVQEPELQKISRGLYLLPGDLGLSVFEDRLALAWPTCLDDNRANAHDAFRVMTSFYRVLKMAAARKDADIVLLDVGPNLGAINRAALVASDYVAVPLGADLFSLQGLRNLGPTLGTWRKGWKKRLEGEVPNIDIPAGAMSPIGYVVLPHAVRQDRPVKAYSYWLEQIPRVYREFIVERQGAPSSPDPEQLGSLKHYRSLMPMAQSAHKPMFSLRPADGAIGSHAGAVQACRDDFVALATRIAERCSLELPV